MWCILQHILQFSAYFEHSIQKQPKTEENHISYIFFNMQNVFLAFLTKKKKKKKKKKKR